MSDLAGKKWNISLDWEKNFGDKVYFINLYLYLKIVLYALKL